MNTYPRKAALLAVCFLFSILPAAAFWGGTAQATAEEQLITMPNGTAPTAQPIRTETVTDVMIQAALSATDPDGDAVTFQLVNGPRMGTAAIEDGCLLYTPASGRTGTDRFTYCAIDTLGNVSAPASIEVKVARNRARLTYADMTHDPSHLAAIQLAEAGVFVGERVGTSYFLRPDQPVTRSEFIAMAAAAADLPLSETAQTDFIDDQALSPWAKPYVSAAAQAGLVSGYAAGNGGTLLHGERTITLAEASVIVSRLLGDPDVVPTAAPSYAVVPAWAAQAASALTAADILPAYARDYDGSAAVSRRTACELLARAMQRCA